MPSSNLLRLRELTEKLPSLNDVVGRRTSDRIEYLTDTGFSVGFSLDRCGEAALQKNFLSAGTYFPAHTHEGWEYLFIVKGEGRYTIDGKIDDFSSGDWIVFPPETLHDFTATTAAVLYAITQPPCEGYPGEQ